MNYSQQPEIVLGNVPELSIPELTVGFSRGGAKRFSGALTHAQSVADFIRTTFSNGEIELQEQFIVLYLSQNNEVIGYYRHSKGGINSTIADKRIILGAALKCAAVQMVLAHNHPSGNLQPSTADKELTHALQEAAKLMDIRVLDHLIVTKKEYYSFADEGLLGLDGFSHLFTKIPVNASDFVTAFQETLRKKVKYNKTSLERFATGFGLTDKNEVKELAELAIVREARTVALGSGDTWDKYRQIVELYRNQVNLSHRTSNSILMQQYSTAAPIAYLAGLFCELDMLTARNGYAYEPSAGNGLLTIAGDARRINVNELDTVRCRNLQSQGFHNVWNNDALIPFKQQDKKFVAVLTNPPFGKAPQALTVNGFMLSKLEHVLAVYALDTMADNGKAAIIVGAHTSWGR